MFGEPPKKKKRTSKDEPREKVSKSASPSPTPSPFSASPSPIPSPRSSPALPSPGPPRENKPKQKQTKQQKQHFGATMTRIRQTLRLALRTVAMTLKRRMARIKQRARERIVMAVTVGDAREGVTKKRRRRKNAREGGNLALSTDAAARTPWRMRSSMTPGSLQARPRVRRSLWANRVSSASFLATRWIR